MEFLEMNDQFCNNDASPSSSSFPFSHWTHPSLGLAWTSRGGTQSSHLRMSLRWRQRPFPSPRKWTSWTLPGMCWVSDLKFSFFICDCFPSIFYFSLTFFLQSVMDPCHFFYLQSLISLTKGQNEKNSENLIAVIGFSDIYCKAV